MQFASSTTGLLRAAKRRVRRTLQVARTYEAPSTPLVRAARRGDAAEVARLIAAGADPNARSPQGRIALHDAAARDQAETAARLLALGADPGLVDRKGRRAFDPANTSRQTLHAIRQHYHRRRAPDLAVSTASPRAQGWAEELDRNGIVKVSGLIGPDLLESLRRDFEGFVACIDARRAQGGGGYGHYDEEEHFWEQDDAYVSNNAFKHSDALVRLAGCQDLVDAARLYVGRAPHIQRGGAMRYLPTPARSNDMFGWHHDMEEKRFKIQVLLTDVGEGGGGQNMSYVLGSHRLFHPHAMYFNNATTLDYCREHMGDLKIFDAVGTAGDIFIFDSNGVHRGNRRETAGIRDVFMVEYTGDESFIWGGDVNRAVVEDMLPAQPNPFELLMRAPKLWDQPRTRDLPVWLENLPHVERWL